jgi:hypothetical protein
VCAGWPAISARFSIRPASVFGRSVVSCCTPLPVTAPDLRFRMVQRRARYAAPMQPVRLAPAILAPCHLVCVLIEVLAAYPMMDAVLGPAQAAEPTFRVVSAGPLVTLLMNG